MRGIRSPASVTWSVDFPEPPTASLLSTAGGLVFVPDARGWLHAYNAKTGKDLWQGNDGATHNGGIISYEAGGKQYIAVPASWGSLAGQDYGTIFGEEAWKSMPTDAGAMIVYALPSSH